MGDYFKKHIFNGSFVKQLQTECSYIYVVKVTLLPSCSMREVVSLTELSKQERDIFMSLFYLSDF